MRLNASGARRELCWDSDSNASCSPSPLFSFSLSSPYSSSSSAFLYSSCSSSYFFSSCSGHGRAVLSSVVVDDPAGVSVAERTQHGSVYPRIQRKRCRWAGAAADGWRQAKGTIFCGVRSPPLLAGCTGSEWACPLPQGLGVLRSSDRSALKRRIKEIQSAAEKERKALDKMEKQKEKQHRRDQEQRRN